MSEVSGPGGGRGGSPRLVDVARHAGVAMGTVSNVLNQPDKVTEGTRERVLGSIAALGFVPHRAARALAAGTSRTIGFVIIDLGNSFFLDMARGAEHEAQAAGLSVLLANSDIQAEKQRTYLDLFTEERVAGVLLAPLPHGDAEVDRLRQLGMHVVLLNADASGAACTVTTDNEHGGYLAARHLIETGRRRLVFAGHPEMAVQVQDRYDGARRAVAETNGAVSLDLLVTREVQVGDGRQIGHEILAMPETERPDGVVAAADLLALGVIQTLLTDSSLRPPDDIAITGYDNNRSAWSSIVPITTIDQPGEQMGATGTRLLLDEINRPDDHFHEHVHLKPRLIVRDSSVRSP